MEIWRKSKPVIDGGGGSGWWNCLLKSRQELILFVHTVYSSVLLPPIPSLALPSLAFKGGEKKDSVAQLKAEGGKKLLHFQAKEGGGQTVLN